MDTCAERTAPTFRRCRLRGGGNRRAANGTRQRRAATAGKAEGSPRLSSRPPTILVVDDEDRIRFASSSARELFGTALLQERNFLDFVEPGERDIARSLMRHVRDARGDDPVHADAAIRDALGKSHGPSSYAATCAQTPRSADW